MDYGAIVKRAWQITWRYKILWLFGFFAGATSYSSSGGSSNYSTSGDEFTNGDIPAEFVEAGRQLERLVENNIGLIVGLVLLGVLVAIAWWVISVAARGGLIHLVNRAEEDGVVKAGDGWSVGFRNWGRLFAISFVLWFPFAIVVAVLLALTVMPVVVTAVGDGDPAAIATGIFGTCGILAISVIVLGVVGVALGLISTLAQRHVVIGGMTALASIGKAWSDLRSRIGELLLMWLLVVALGIAFGVAIVALSVVVGLGIVVTLFTTGPCGAGLLGLLLVFALMLPGAVFAAFVSAIWTLYWRRMTGRDTAAAQPPAAPAPYEQAVPPAPAPPQQPAPQQPAPPESPPSDPTEGT